METRYGNTIPGHLVIFETDGRDNMLRSGGLVAVPSRRRLPWVASSSLSDEAQGRQHSSLTFLDSVP